MEYKCSEGHLFSVQSWSNHVPVMCPYMVDMENDVACKGSVGMVESVRRKSKAEKSAELVQMFNSKKRGKK